MMLSTIQFKMCKHAVSRTCTMTIYKSCSHLWCWTALGPMLLIVNTAKQNAGNVQFTTAKPHHSRISPKKLAPDTYVNIPPERSYQTNVITCYKSSHSNSFSAFLLIILTHSGKKKYIIIVISIINCSIYKTNCLDFKMTSLCKIVCKYWHCVSLRCLMAVLP